MIVNFSVWTDLASLKAFMYETDHVGYLRRRMEWFRRSDVATSACWWIPAGETPDVGDGYRRLLHLREHGPTSTAWPIGRPLPAPA
jgi:hypothetical protein